MKRALSCCKMTAAQGRARSSPCFFAQSWGSGGSGLEALENLESKGLWGG